AVPLSLSAPATGSVVIRTAWRPLAGLSWGSVNPKSARANVYGVSSSVVTVVAVPTGASLTGVTFTVSARGVGSRSTPPLAVPPLSCTWKVKLAYGVPLASAAGANTSRPASRSPTLTNWPATTVVPRPLSVPVPGSVVIFTAWMASAAGVNTSPFASRSPTLTNWPAVTAVPLSLSVPVPGSVVIFTAWKASGGLSWGSVKPKSARANVYGVSSNVVTVGGVPTGA